MAGMLILIKINPQYVHHLGSTKYIHLTSLLRLRAGGGSIEQAASSLMQRWMAAKSKFWTAVTIAGFVRWVRDAAKRCCERRRISGKATAVKGGPLDEYELNCT